MDLKGKACVVTGGARNLGKQIAKNLLERGAKVCIVDVLKDCAEKTVEEFQSQYGKENAMFIYCDVTDKDAVEAAFSKVVSDFGGLDVLFNNAGITMPIERVIKINLQGAIDVMESAISRMRTDTGGKGGAIVCTASIAGFDIFACAPEYHASKHGLVGYTRSRALECGKKFGINFRIIAPGIMDTELFRALNDSLTVPMAELETYCPKEDLDSLELTQTARTAVLCVEKQDLPQGALVKVIKNGSFLMFPEKMPSEKLMDA